MSDSLRALLMFVFAAAAFMPLAHGFSNGPWWIGFPAAVAVNIGVGILLYRGRELRRQRAAKGLCMTCGYDLTGNVSGVCPECGQAK